jgi:Dolichyl-phosphate-mannose-protein mannosyltransferase
MVTRMRVDAGMRSGSVAPSAVVALLALALYLPAFGWGSPHATAANRTHAWGVDDETPLGVLGQVANIVRPSDDRNAGYPKLHPLLVTAAVAPYLGAVWLRGGFEAPSAEYPYGLRDPEQAIRHLAWIAHALAALLGALAIAAGFDAAALCWDARSAAYGALLAAVMFPMFYYARTGNVDVPMLCFVALLSAALARASAFGVTPARAAWVGAFAAAALATKESAAGATLGAAIALLVLVRRSSGPGERLRALGACAASGLAVYALASGALLDTQWWLRHIAEISGKAGHLATGDSPVARAFAMTLAGHWGFARATVEYLAAAMSGPGLALGAAGLAFALAAERSRAWLAWPALGYLGFAFLALRSAQLRYVLPFAFFLAFFGGRLVARAIAARSWPLRVAAASVLTLAIGLGILRGAALTYEMQRDSRYAAGAWLAERTAPGDRIEFFGASQTLPPIEPGVVTAPATEFQGMFVKPRVDDAKVEEILQGLRERRPRFVLVIPDHTSTGGLEHSFVLPPQLFSALMAGELEWKLVADFRTPPLFPWLSRPLLDYPTVNPPIRVFAVREGAGSAGGSSRRPAQSGEELSRMVALRKPVGRFGR